MTTTDGKIPAHIKRLEALLVEQIHAAKGWPVCFVFPTPQDDIEQVALRLFLAEVEKETGTAIIFTTEPGRA